MKRQKLDAKQTIETSMKMLSKEIIVSAQQIDEIHELCGLVEERLQNECKSFLN